MMKKPAHPGIVFRETYLKALGISVKDTAAILGISTKHISNIINGKVGITADMATRISMMTNTSAKLWLGMQNSYDLSKLDMDTYQYIKSDTYIPEIKI